MYLNLVREIKAAILNSENLPDEFIVELASEYRQACDEVNRRLISVTSLLKMGCRDEAVQVADYPRSLLDSVRELNFKQRKDWVQVLADKKLEVPPRLEFPSAVRLEEAYKKLDELAPLLKKNRLLALAQAPLQSRTLILNKLIQQDPENNVWKLDLAALQEARLVEIKDELRKAKKKGDGNKVRDLAAELGAPWTVEVPPALMVDAKNALNDIGMEGHLKEMEAVADALNKYLVESDEESALPLRQQWLKLNKIANLQSNDPLAQKAREPLAWLETNQQQRIADRNYQQAKTNLQHAIDQKLPIEELDKRTALVSNFGRDTSAELLGQSKTYRKAVLYEQHRQSRILKYVMIACGVAALLAAGWFGLAQSRQGTISESREALSQFVNDGALESGQRYYQQLPGYVKSDNEISRLHARMATLEKDESQRVAMFEEVTGRLDLTGELGDQADDLIDRARQYASSDSEKERLSDLKKNLDDARQQRQNERTESYRIAAKPMEDELAAMLAKVKNSTAMPEALAGVTKKLNAFKTNANIRTDGMAGISLSAKQRTEDLISAANLAIDRSRKKKQSAETLTTLKQQAVKLRNLGAALSRFEKLYPENPNSRDFRASVAEQNHWDGFRQWQALAATVQKYDIEDLAKEELEDFQDDMNAASELTRFTNWPKSLEKTTAFLDSMVSDRSALFDKLGEVQAFFKQRNHTELHVLHRGEDRYYLADEFQPEQRKFSYFKRGQAQAQLNYAESDIGGLAGHCVVAKNVLKQFENFSGDIDQALLKLLMTALVRSKELNTVNGPTIDPLVQADFVDRILGLIEELSPNLKRFAGRQRELMRNLQVTGLSWRNVLDQVAQAARPKAARAIETIRQSFSEAQTVVAENMGSMKTWGQLANFAPAGIIYKNGVQWIADVAVPVQDGQALYCMLPGRRNTASLDKVGVYRSGVVDRGESILPLQAGRPIFVLSGKEKK